MRNWIICAITLLMAGCCAVNSNADWLAFTNYSRHTPKTPASGSVALHTAQGDILAVATLEITGVPR